YKFAGAADSLLQVHETGKIPKVERQEAITASKLEKTMAFPFMQSQLTWVLTFLIRQLKWLDKGGWLHAPATPA
ncbi:MAG: hypothetical protein OEV35_08115, partial [Gallionellaceae bacterium]|nr:hypothetical protein [Gallionellaceae bacterium]